MKVAPTADFVRYVNQVQEKRDSEGGQQNSGRDQQGNQKNREENPEIFEVTDEKVGLAIQSFQHDAQALANGLTAQLQGAGPGLKVILKDGAGGVLRHFTGEEFLRLREAVANGKSGKILDQKI
jgi:hypothetical protein